MKPESRFGICRVNPKHLQQVKDVTSRVSLLLEGLTI